MDPAIGGPGKHGCRGFKTTARSHRFSKWGSVTKVPVALSRQVIARRMWENWNAIPHVTQFGNADFTRLDELRRKHAPAYEAEGAKLTVTPLVWGPSASS